ncbi:MAG: Vitamin B12 dependent methionine synthase activation subunit [Evtepia sp.]|nr:Vitamin B12 dependent methionine synthase activation subunit [Evtepia sp.]
MNLDPREIARYLGIRGKALDPQGTAWADQCQGELAQAVTPRHLGRRLPLTLFQGQSRDLDHHLRHCREGILYAVTLGPEADRLLRRWSAQSMAKAAVGQAVCAAWLDALCAAYCESLQQGLAPGEYLTPPFSPGYGDWDLAAQQTVLDRLQAPKRLGLSLTGGGMLVPEKSVTALVGISDRPEEACGQKCMRCRKTDCPFRAGPA